MKYKPDPKFIKTFETYPVMVDWDQTMERYILHGLDPGGFFTSVLANDLMMAAARSHVHNDWNCIQNLVKWIVQYAPPSAWGSYEAVNEWCNRSQAEREKICEAMGLATTMWDVLTAKKIPQL